MRVRDLLRGRDWPCSASYVLHRTHTIVEQVYAFLLCPLTPTCSSLCVGPCQAGNWGWRMGGDEVWDALAAPGERLKGLLRAYNRLPRK